MYSFSRASGASLFLWLGVRLAFSPPPSGPSQGLMFIKGTESDPGKRRVARRRFPGLVQGLLGAKRADGRGMFTEWIWSFCQHMWCRNRHPGTWGSPPVTILIVRLWLPCRGLREARAPGLSLSAGWWVRSIWDAVTTVAGEPFLTSASSRLFHGEY